MTGVSIALATYNGATFLGEQLASLARQNRLPDELVVTDDASSDTTIAMLEAFSADAPFPVRIHQNPVRLGYRANFMKAMQLCQSNLIALCDQDDIWDADKLTVAVRALEDPEVLLFFHGATLIDRAGMPLGTASIMSLPARSPPLSFFPLMNPYGFSIVFRRSLVASAQHWDLSIDTMDQTSRMAHDQWVFFLASVFGTIAYSDAHLVQYRQHGGNAYGSKGGWDGIRHRVTALFHNNGADHELFSRAASARGRLLRTMATNISPSQREKAEVSAAYYEGLSARLALRGQIYLSQHLHDRTMAFLRLARAGGYSKGKLWNIGPKAVVKDLGLGVLFRQLLRTVDDNDRKPTDLRLDLEKSPH